MRKFYGYSYVAITVNDYSVPVTSFGLVYAESSNRAKELVKEKYKNSFGIKPDFCRVSLVNIREDTHIENGYLVIRETES